MCGASPPRASGSYAHLPRAHRRTTFARWRPCPTTSVSSAAQRPQLGEIRVWLLDGTAEKSSSSQLRCGDRPRGAARQPARALRLLRQCRELVQRRRRRRAARARLHAPRIRAGAVPPPARRAAACAAPCARGAAGGLSTAIKAEAAASTEPQVRADALVCSVSADSASAFRRASTLWRRRSAARLHVEPAGRRAGRKVVRHLALDFLADGRRMHRRRLAPLRSWSALARSAHSRRVTCARARAVRRSTSTAAGR